MQKIAHMLQYLYYCLLYFSISSDLVGFKKRKIALKSIKNIVSEIRYFLHDHKMLPQIMVQDTVHLDIHGLSS